MDVRARGTLRSESGFALMEVIVSAAVLVLVVLGVLAAMDSVARTAGANKAKTVAATLAEKDQERLRGMHIDQVGGPLGGYDVDVAGVTYRVESKAVWVADGSDEEVGCGAKNSEGSYLRLTSTVTSPITGASVKPVVLSSIMAPRQKGALIVLVKNAAEQPVQGLTVTAPPLTSKVTNSAGCAVFSQIDAGNYTVGLNQSGWVDWNGNPTPTKLAGVTAGNITTVDFAYDRAATATVTVQNKPTAQGGVLEPAKTVLGAHPKPTTGMRTSSAPVVPSPNPYPVDNAVKTGASFVMTNLFPFPEGYTFYSGACLGADPSKQVPDYFSTYSGALTLGPGESRPVTVYEPPVNITVRRDSVTGTLADATAVYAYPKAAGCTGIRIPLGTTTSSGTLAYPGLPYGEYDICARRTSGTDRRGTMTLLVKDPAGVTPAAPLVITADTNGCGNTAP
jgi:hypothetical protein